MSESDASTYEPLPGELREALGSARALPATVLPAPVPEEHGRRSDGAHVAWLRHISWGPLLMALAVLLHCTAVWLGERSGSMLVAMSTHALAAFLTFTGAWLFTARDLPAQRITLWSAPNLARGFTVAVAVLWMFAVVLAALRMETFWVVILALASMAAESAAIARHAIAAARRSLPEQWEGQTQLQNMVWVMPLFFAAMIWLRFTGSPEKYGQLFCELPLIGDGFCWLLNSSLAIGAAFNNFIFQYPLIGLAAGLMLWLMTTLVRLTAQLRASASILQKPFVP